MSQSLDSVERSDLGRRNGFRSGDASCRRDETQWGVLWVLSQETGGVSRGSGRGLVS